VSARHALDKKFPMADRRRVILEDARRRYADGQRLALGWSWAHCMKTAAAADRIRRAEPRALMAGRGRDKRKREEYRGLTVRDACDIG
jgi:hypothetical protein